MEPFALTKEEFIIRSMAGEIFICKDSTYCYDSGFIIPFRSNINTLEMGWGLFDGITKQFTLQQPKPKIERRWKWRKDNKHYTEETDCYHSDVNVSHLQGSDWYKAEDCFIDVEIKG